MKKIILPLIIILPLMSVQAREITLNTEVAWNSSVLSRVAVNIVSDYRKKSDNGINTGLMALFDEVLREMEKNEYKGSLNNIANICMDKCTNSYVKDWLEEDGNWTVEKQCPELCEKYVLDIVEFNNKDFYDNSRYFGDITYYSRVKGNSKEVCQKLIEKSEVSEPLLCSGYCSGTNSNLVAIVDYEVSKRFGVKAFCDDGETGYRAYIFNNGTIEDVTNLSEKEALEKIRSIQTDTIVMQ